MTGLSRDRAERLAKAHACAHCREYSFRKLAVKPAPASLAEELQVVWVVVRTCGVCGVQSELGIQDDGDIVYEG
ncbi:MAG: hypothetical protein K1X31_01310 [Gemmatimonadaceae bacterium]|nr:hypothetical protein [Gemmatimonadaceae bacterium]